jgi:hypothetical protein
MIGIVLQIVLPLALLVWLAAFPTHSLAGYIAQAAGVGLTLLGLALVALWTFPPWWVAWVYLALWAAASGVHARRIGLAAKAWPSGSGWVATLAGLGLAGIGSWAVTLALGARALPDVEVVDIPNPLGPGTYLVANGGSGEILNGHLETLDPNVPRFADWRGQSRGVDLVEIHGWGLRSDGIQPVDPSRYAMFGRAVHAPCDGRVVGAEDGHPDMPVPEMDRAHMAGNHILLRCGEAVILLAHFREGSVRVRKGQAVAAGDRLGDVGNSGNSSEPHLHVHAQRESASSMALAGKPLALRIDGRFPVRNARIKGQDW